MSIRGSKKARLAVIVLLLIVAAALFFMIEPETAEAPVEIMPMMEDVRMNDGHDASDDTTAQ